MHLSLPFASFAMVSAWRFRHLALAAIPLTGRRLGGDAGSLVRCLKVLVPCRWNTTRIREAGSCVADEQSRNESIEYVGVSLPQRARLNVMEEPLRGVGQKRDERDHAWVGQRLNSVEGHVARRLAGHSRGPANPWFSPRCSKARGALLDARDNRKYGGREWRAGRAVRVRRSTRRNTRALPSAQHLRPALRKGSRAAQTVALR